MNRIHESKYNDERYEVLSRLGIEVYEKADEIYIIHAADKRMMEGIEYLCKAPARSSQVVKKLEENLSGMKIRAKIKPLRGIVSDFRWKVEYAYKGKNICGFYADKWQQYLNEI